MKHSLLSAYGSKWADRFLAMFTIFIDDSGSAPEHKMAIASGIVVPAIKIVPLENEWNSFLQKEGIPEFHASECLARNPHSAFANWDDARVRRVFARVRQMTLKYSVRGFCIAIHKDDYTQVMPEDMRKRVGSFYTWAVSSVIGMAYDFSVERGVEMEYVFDTAEKEVKREIDEAMLYSERLHPGCFVGHYSFRKRVQVPTLQAADLFAWTCYQAARHTRFNHPIHDIAAESWLGYWSAHQGSWRRIESLNRQGIEDWVKKTYLSPEDLAIKEFKEKQQEARRPKAKKAR